MHPGRSPAPLEAEAFRSKFQFAGSDYDSFMSKTRLLDIVIVQFIFPACYIYT